MWQTLTLRRYPLTALTILCLLAFSCCRKSVSALKREGVAVAERRVDLESAPGALNAISVQYLGCGGLLVRHEGQAVLIDPFYSHQPFLRIGKSMRLGGRIRSDPGQIAVGKKRILDSLYADSSQFRKEAKAILTAHGHYDHLMDVPYIHRHWFGGQPEVYVNSSGFNSIANVVDTAKLHKMEPMISTPTHVGQAIDLHAPGGETMKIYPIRGDHNPHTRKSKFFCGSVAAPPEDFEKPTDKTSVYNWLEGQTVSFLIDIVSGNAIVFRMFVQSSSCAFPGGIPPEALLRQKPVDLAVMGVASYRFSEATYPCQYLEMLTPKNIMFIHWEDFFRKYHRKPKSVMRTDIPRFFREILPQCRNDYLLPLPGVVVSAKY